MPFTQEQFFQVFEKYNLAVYPSQIVLILAACAAVILAGKPRRFSDKIVSGLLAFLWLWEGVVYHLIFFTEINPAAYVFGALFVAQGLLFFHKGVLKNGLSFRFEQSIDGVLGITFIVYALITL